MTRTFATEKIAYNMTKVTEVSVEQSETADKTMFQTPVRAYPSQLRTMP